MKIFTTLLFLILLSGCSSTPEVKSTYVNKKLDSISQNIWIGNYCSDVFFDVKPGIFKTNKIHQQTIGECNHFVSINKADTFIIFIGDPNGNFDDDVLKEEYEYSLNPSLFYTDAEIAEIDCVEGSKCRSDLSFYSKGLVVKFKTNSFEFEGSSDLTRFAEVVSKNKLKLFIVGHTDNVHTKEYNIELSKKRALNIKSKFIDLGVSESSVKTSWYGFDRPVSDNSNPDSRSKNRRVEISPNIEGE